jgi:hypothetical protein
MLKVYLSSFFFSLTPNLSFFICRIRSGVGFGLNDLESTSVVNMGPN